jgi:hypothetical protein
MRMLKVACISQSSLGTVHLERLRGLQVHLFFSIAHSRGEILAFSALVPHLGAIKGLGLLGVDQSLVCNGAAEVLSRSPRHCYRSNIHKSEQHMMQQLAVSPIEELIQTRLL